MSDLNVPSSESLSTTIACSAVIFFSLIFKALRCWRSSSILVDFLIESPVTFLCCSQLDDHSIPGSDLAPLSHGSYLGLGSSCIGHVALAKHPLVLSLFVGKQILNSLQQALLSLLQFFQLAVITASISIISASSSASASSRKSAISASFLMIKSLSLGVLD